MVYFSIFFLHVSAYDERAMHFVAVPQCCMNKINWTQWNERPHTHTHTLALAIVYIVHELAARKRSMKICVLDRRVVIRFFQFFFCYVSEFYFYFLVQMTCMRKSHTKWRRPTKPWIQIAVELCSCSYIAGSVVHVHAIYLFVWAPTWCEYSCTRHEFRVQHHRAFVYTRKQHTYTSEPPRSIICLSLIVKWNERETFSSRWWMCSVVRMSLLQFISK